MGRSAELEEFLKRVEDYDLQRRGNNDVVKTASNTNKEINDGYSEESLERARKLLSENGVAIVDREPRSSTLDAPELAYRSAYNYERTFSPKRVTTSSKTYMVSEDDYLLLQRLKAKEKPPAPLPPHEKSRKNDRLRTLLDGVATPHFSKTSTSLPSSNYYSLRLESRKTESPHIEAPRNKEPPPVPPKSRSRTKDELEDLEPRKDGKKPISPLGSPPSSPTKSPVKVELKSSPRKFNLKAELEPPEKTLPIDNGKPSSSTREPPSSSLPHLDFLDSAQRNKVESNLETPESKPQTKSSSLHSNQFIDSAVHKSTPPTKPAKPLQLANTPKNSFQRTDSGSFISSALKSSSPQLISFNDIRTNFTVPSKPSTETFINSALKASPPPPPTPPRKTATITIPRPLTKPASLRKSSTAPENDEFKPEKPAGLAQLRPTSSNEKPKPRVPPKKSELVLPKLRHVDPVDSHGNEIKQEAEFTANLKKTRPPEVPKKNPSLPEALTRLGNLSRAEPPPKREEDLPEALTKVGHLSRAPPSPRKTEDVPEALAHLEKLNKVSKQQPPVPTRKISMGEALQKAQELKKQQQKKLQSSEEEQKHPKDVKSELGAVLMAQKLRSSKPSLSSSSSTEPSSTNSSTTTLDSGSKPNTLSHATKTRSKGPRRRIPTSIKK
ncbi:hypothetical protein ZYGR_0AK00460 [Zygosaccharomyces rouxii]|uniref:Uncharacterized protein n=1 Tax=Zygosaccharomyces rouxii TaxID=4956 RepID=A0A1Q3ACP5_ZYGRO|nr:hypothetical protein ZYGR_0AK00460 [Zygosaccharomyces rouxii]